MPLFKKIKGQDRAVNLLRQALENEKIAQSYLFYGPEGIGKFTTALYFLMAVNCVASLSKRPCGICNSCKKMLNFSHPDFMYIFPTPNFMNEEGEIKETKFIPEYESYLENKRISPWKEVRFSANVEIRIADVRLLQRRISFSPNESKFKVFLIEHVDQMNEKAANAFLKTLEEPPADTIIVMTTSRPNSLLATILSRCQKIPFLPLSGKIIENELKENGIVEDLEARIYGKIANGNMEKAFNLSEESMIESRKLLLTFLKNVLNGDEPTIIDFIDNFKGSKTIKYLDEFISHLMTWIADIALFSAAPEEIVNIDQTDLIEKFYYFNPRMIDDLPDYQIFLEGLRFKIGGNVNPQLILTEIYTSFKSRFNL